MTGRDMKLPIDLALDSVRNQDTPASANFTEDLITLWRNVKEKLETDQWKNKVSIDKKRRKHNFNIGDKVLLSTSNLKLRDLSPKL